jgi:hypothetical protein
MTTCYELSPLNQINGKYWSQTFQCIFHKLEQMLNGHLYSPLGRIVSLEMYATTIVNIIE